MTSPLKRVNRAETQIDPEDALPLPNVTRMIELAYALRDRPPGSEPLGVFMGDPGLGKSVAGVVASMKLPNCRFMRACVNWTARDLVTSVLNEMGEFNFKGATHKRAEKIIELLLSETDPILIFDEADYLAAPRLADTIRDIAELSKAAIILIGMDKLDARLTPNRQFHSRVARWVNALPCGLAEARELARLYQPNVAIEDDLLSRVVASSKGVTRVICNTLYEIGEFAAVRNMQAVNLAAYDGYVHTAPVLSAARLVNRELAHKKDGAESGHRLLKPKKVA